MTLAPYLEAEWKNLIIASLHRRGQRCKLVNVIQPRLGRAGDPATLAGYGLYHEAAT
jgi:hypothetical protein